MNSFQFLNVQPANGKAPAKPAAKLESDEEESDEEEEVCLVMSSLEIHSIALILSSTSLFIQFWFLILVLFQVNTPAKQPAAEGSKTVFVKNLAWGVTQDTL